MWGRAVTKRVQGETKEINIRLPNVMKWEDLVELWISCYIFVCVVCFFLCLNKTKATACARLVKACRVLAESQATWKCQGSHTQSSEGSAHSRSHEWSWGWETYGKKKVGGGRERERPVKYCTQSYTVIPAAQCHLRLPPLSVSSPWCLIPVESMGSALSGATQTKTDRYSNKSLVGWFL